MGHKVLVVTSSARKNGNSVILANAFIRGAEEAGHEVRVFDAAKASMDGCHGDASCHKTGACGLKDDGVKLHELLQWADTLLLASPLYFGGFNAQMKKVIDRFYPYAAPKGREKLAVKTVYLIATGASRELASFKPMEAIFDHALSVLKLEEGGKLFAMGLKAPGEAANYDSWMRKAVRMGMNIGAYTNDI
ncbi:MAG: flavodoxin family protein [Lachnospiraceae bacterium]|nr:flavodoxin family protein [Lachnospiraceae bacterium]